MSVATFFPESEITALSQWIFNCYLVHDGGAGRPFVVDVGVPSHVPAIFDGLRSRGSDASELALALATHGHEDHVGGLPALRERAPIDVGLPAGIQRLLEGGPLRTPGPRQIARILPVMADQPFALRPLGELARLAKTIGYSQLGVFFPFSPRQWLADGSRVEGAPDWEVLLTPGHTDDSVSFYNAATRTLLAGDAVLSVGGRAWFNPEYVDADLSIRTEERLRSLNIEHLFPGHGRPVSGPRLMDEALSFSERPAGTGPVSSLRRVFGVHRRVRAVTARSPSDSNAPGRSVRLRVAFARRRPAS